MHLNTDRTIASWRALAATLTLALVLLLATVGTPSAALGQVLESDTIVGIPLSESGLTAAAPDVNARAGLVMDDDGRVLWERDMEKQRAMASVTKIMTALLVLENADLDDSVTVSQRASDVDYAIGLEAGERLTVRELLQYALVGSSNDSAIALAEHIAGGESAFVAMMNARAAELGLDDTRYANAHGLDEPGHHSSAADIVELSRLAMQDPEFRRIVTIEELTLPAYKDRPAEKIENTDELMGEYEGMLGVKTGFTDDAGYCFVGEAERDGIGFTTVVLGTRSNDARFDDTEELLDWGFEHLTWQTIATTTETVGALPILQNDAYEITLGFAQTTATPVFDLDGEVTRTVSADSAVSLPIYEGQPLGTAELHQGDRVLATVPIVATRDISSAEETVGSVPVSDFIDVSVIARAADDSQDVPEFDPDIVIARNVVLDPEVGAPVQAGDQLGEIVYTQEGETVLTVPVVAVTGVEAPTTIERVGIFFERAWNWVTGQPRMATVQLIEG